MDTSFLGELAGLGTAAMWSFSSIFFTIGGKRVGSVIVNRARLALAVLLVGATHWLAFGRPFPTGAEPDRYLWLALSSLIGLVIGDSMLFQCYVLVGARIGVLLLSLAPVFSAIFAWAALGEKMAPLEAAAMALSLGGVAWVVLERSKGTGRGREIPRRDYFLGVLFGIGAACCQALALVTAKKGLDAGFPALSGVMIRMSVGAILLWSMAAFQGQAFRTVRKLRADRRASLAILGGAILGPFIGVWLALVSVQAALVGIASTLMAMPPILSLPLVRHVFRERISPRTLLGTLVAMAGIAVIMLV